MLLKKVFFFFFSIGKIYMIFHDYKSFRADLVSRAGEGTSWIVCFLCCSCCREFIDIIKSNLLLKIQGRILKIHFQSKITIAKTKKGRTRIKNGKDSVGLGRTSSDKMSQNIGFLLYNFKTRIMKSHDYIIFTSLTFGYYLPLYYISFYFVTKIVY